MPRKSSKNSSVSVEMNTDMSYDEIASLTEWAMGVSREKKQDVQKKALKLMRKLIQRGAIITFGDTFSSKRGIVRKVRGKTVTYEKLNRNGDVVKQYQKYRVTSKKGRRLVRKVYLPSFELGAPGCDDLQTVTSIRVDGKLVYRRSDFLRKEKATRLSDVGRRRNYAY